MAGLIKGNRINEIELEKGHAKELDSVQKSLESESKQLNTNKVYTEINI